MKYCIIVTGGTGFIGQTLVRKLEQRLASDTAILPMTIIPVGSSDTNLTDASDTFDFFRKVTSEYQCLYLFHLAALYKAGGWPINHPATQFFINLSMNVNVLEAWWRYCPKARLTSILSYCMYPPGDNAHPESELWGTEPEEYLYSYAMTKKALVVGQRAYSQEHGMESCGVLLPTVYGPNDRFMEDSHVMGALIGKFVRATRFGYPTVEVWGDGEQEREFLYVDDAVDGIIAIAQRVRPDIFNLGTGHSNTIRSIVEIIQEKTGFKGDVIYNTERFVGVKKRRLDISYISRGLGWNFSTNLKDGIYRTVDWYVQELDKNPAKKNM